MLEKIIDGNDLEENEARQILQEMMSGQMEPAKAAAYLVALKMKGESVGEITAFARGMRESASRIEAGGNLVDTCGTGGDSKGTFNISTASAFIAAGAGVRIAKHGNRAVSGKCGSADLLEELGVRMVGPEKVKACIGECGFGFMFAPLFHPAMRNVMPVRRALGIRTVFNLLGPLTNPASADAQVIGVYDPKLCEVFAKVLQNLGCSRALIVHSEGMDEIGLGKTKITELSDGIRSYTIDAKDFGFERREIPKASTREESAAIVMGLLKGEKGAARDVCLLNAAAAIYAGGNAGSIEEGAGIAAESVDSGSALGKLEQVVRYTGE